MSTFYKRISILVVIALIFSISAGLTIKVQASDWDIKAAEIRLSQLGIIKNQNDDSFLYTYPNRLDAGIMLLNALGLEKAAQSNRLAHPYSDVPVWADFEIGYLHSNKLLGGISSDKFGPEFKISAAEYCTLMLHALGYSELNGDFDLYSSVTKAVESGIITDSQTSELGDFTYGDMLVLTSNTLNTSIKGESKTLLQSLTEKGLLSVNTNGSEKASNTTGQAVDLPSASNSTGSAIENSASAGGTAPKAASPNQTTSAAIQTPSNPPKSPGTATPSTPAPKNSGAQSNQNNILESFKKLFFYIEANSNRYVAYKLKNPTLSFETAACFVNIGLDKPFYTNVRTIKDPYSLTVLVNKYSKLPDNFNPKLVQINSAYSVSGRGKQLMRPEAKDAFEKMCADAQKLGLKIKAYGTYRSIATQSYIWNSKIKMGRTVADVDSLNARAGYSEHHTGLAVDVLGNGYWVGKTKEYAWYKDNAYKYGFIIRYLPSKESISGYKNEPWHLRYVGPEIAKAVYQSGLSYDEYYWRYLYSQENVK